MSDTLKEIISLGLDAAIGLKDSGLTKADIKPLADKGDLDAQLVLLLGMVVCDYRTCQTCDTLRRHLRQRRVQSDRSPLGIPHPSLQIMRPTHFHVEGYTDLRSIYIVMSQEYPGQFDRKTTLAVIRRALT